MWFLHVSNNEKLNTKAKLLVKDNYKIVTIVLNGTQKIISI